MPLFAALAATWPAAEQRRIGPWTLRRGMGGGGRVSAATFHAPEGDKATAADIDLAERQMRSWRQSPRFMLRPGEAGLDAALAARGYLRADPTLLLAAPVAVLAPDRPDERAIDCAAPLACMAGIWAAGGIGPARLAVMDRAAGPKTWLLGRLGDRPAACAFVAVSGAVAMLHALEVAPGARRQGLGAWLSRAAADWARHEGAAMLALAVTEANAPARALYAGLGLAEAARYHYRIAPPDVDTAGAAG